MAPIISIELLEDELKAVVQAGAYTSKEEVIGHALEVLLVAHEPLRIKTAVRMPPRLLGVLPVRLRRTDSAECMW